jgi:hypothetical protein
MHRGTIWLVAGLLLIHAAFWVGPFGVLDLYEYAQNAESLWLDLRWDMRLPQAAPGDPPFSRFSIGLPILSGPFVYAGQLVEWLSGGHVGRRWIMTMFPPLALVAACVLLERIGLLLGQAPRVSRWAAIILGLSGASLYYTRLYHVEPVVGLMALLSVYGFLRSGSDPSHRRRWLLVCGTGAGLAVMCHYANAPLIACLGLTFLVASWRRARPDERAGDLVVLAVVPAVVALMIMGMNWHCFGNPLRTGYSDYDNGVAHVLSERSWSRNVLALGKVLAGAPWVLVVAALFARHRRATGDLRWCAIAALAGLAAQAAFWMAFKYYWWSPLRYDVPWIMVAAIGLPLLGTELVRRWPLRGLAYATLILLALALSTFLGTFDFDRPFMNDTADPLYPGRTTAAIWYTWHAGYVAAPGYIFGHPPSDDWYVYPLVPLEAWHLAVLLTMVGAGSALLWRSQRAMASVPDRLALTSRVNA